MLTQVLSALSLLVIWYGFYNTTTPPRPPAALQTQVGTQRVVVYRRKMAFMTKIIHTIVVSAELYACIWKGWAKGPAFVEEWCGEFSSEVYPAGKISTLLFLASLCCSIGGVTRLLCYRALGNLFTWEVSIQKSHRLITKGPYSFVRHPSYIGLALVYIGVGLFITAPGTLISECFARQHDTTAYWLRWGYTVFSLMLVSWLFARIPTEDRILHKEFGKEWEKWAKQTPYRLVPFIF